MHPPDSDPLHSLTVTPHWTLTLTYLVTFDFAGENCTNASSQEVPVIYYRHVDELLLCNPEVCSPASEQFVPAGRDFDLPRHVSRYSGVIPRWCFKILRFDLPRHLPLLRGYALWCFNIVFLSPHTSQHTTPTFLYFDSAREPRPTSSVARARTRERRGSPSSIPGYR